MLNFNCKISKELISFHSIPDCEVDSQFSMTGINQCHSIWSDAAVTERQIINNCRPNYCIFQNIHNFIETAYVKESKCPAVNRFADL